jgi:nitronate monooxygenase
MDTKHFKELIIGDLKAKIPIIQGGMGIGISLSGLAAAVANEGGIGVIATAGIGRSEPDYFSNYLEANKRALKKEIRKAKEMTKGILGVNIMVALSNFSDMVKTAAEEKIDIIFSGAGLPLQLPKILKDNKVTKLVPIVASGRAAKIICRKWSEKFNRLPDALVVEGPKAGGHLGFKFENLDAPEFSLENLVPEVIQEVKTFEEQHQQAVPIIPAGGIYTGEDIHDFLCMGAAGVQMATRFVTTYECDSSDAFKQAFLDSKKDDIVIIKSPVGMPGRAIRNNFIDEINMGKKKPFKCPYHCIITCDLKNSPFCINHALVNAQRGNFRSGFAFAGSNAYRTKEIISVKDLMESLVQEYKNINLPPNKT